MVYQIDRLIKEYDQERDHLYAASLGHSSGYKEESEEAKIKRLLPKEYHHFVPLFKKAVADVLPPHQQYDHKITLKEGFTPPFGLIYSLSIPELKVLREWLDENVTVTLAVMRCAPRSADYDYDYDDDDDRRRVSQTNIDILWTKLQTCIFSLTESRLRLGYRTLREEARENGEGGSFMDTVGLFYTIDNYAINNIEAIT